jgi:hypothetical protein
VEVQGFTHQNEKGGAEGRSYPINFLGLLKML